MQALGVRCSMPDWLLRELSTTVLPEPAALCAWAEANQRAPRLALRVNPLRASAEEVAAALAAEPWGLQAEAVPGMPHLTLTLGFTRAPNPNPNPSPNPNPNPNPNPSPRWPGCLTRCCCRRAEI